MLISLMVLIALCRYGMSCRWDHERRMRSLSRYQNDSLLYIRRLTLPIAVHRRFMSVD